MSALSRCALALSFGSALGAAPDVQSLSRINYEVQNNVDGDPMDGLWCNGLSASGFEKGAQEGRDGQYLTPRTNEIKFFHDQGANCFRVPITWERLQSQVGSTDLDPVDGFASVIEYITEDLEDFAIIVPLEGMGGGLRYNGENVNKTSFVNLWTAVSKRFAANPRVIFELYDYPKGGCHNGDCGSGNSGFFTDGDSDLSGTLVNAWLEWTQGAVTAIRAEGATNTVLVPGYKPSCRDWAGAEFWGQPLDGYANSGNLALFSLEDPAKRTAYAVHQWFDRDMVGTQAGCPSHDNFIHGGWSADEGCLTHAVNMANTYGKKLWLTETASFTAAEPGDEQWTTCEQKMGDFLQGMADSGAFLGYQAWQFGCADCGSTDFREDLWGEWFTPVPEAPLGNNLGWYDLKVYGPTSTTTTSSTTTRTTSTSTTSTATTSTSTQTTSTSTTSTVTTSTSTVTETSGAALLPSAFVALAASLAQLLAR